MRWNVATAYPAMISVVFAASLLATIPVLRDARNHKTHRQQAKKY
jgi:uncharacterized membrane protein